LELIIASDASEDRTDEILQSFNDSRLKYVRMDSRVGKNEALNRLARLATGDLLLFTDANTHIGKDCLRGMVRYFADPRVGCVTGTEHTQTEEHELAVSSGTRAYLNYELLIDQLESRVGSVIVCDGSLFVVRRALFHQLQPDLANDLELPLSIGYAGHALLPRGIQSETPHLRARLFRVLATPPLPARFSGLAILFAKGAALAGTDSHDGNLIDDRCASGPALFRFLVRVASCLLHPSFGRLAVRLGWPKGKHGFGYAVLLSGRKYSCGHRRCSRLHRAALRCLGRFNIFARPI
ncbi:MAG: glycosyltransferase, partial [Candidatus Acidiferrales bacterium]